jgi:hypothetical protein
LLNAIMILPPRFTEFEGDGLLSTDMRIQAQLREGKECGG